MGFLLLLPASAAAQDDDDAPLIYGSGAGNQPQERVWDDSLTTWNGASALPAANATIEWTVTKYSPGGLERIVGVLSDTGAATDLDILRYNGATWSVDWSSTAITVANTAYRGFDVEYEANSGDAMVVYSDNTTNPQYQTRTGGAWSGAASVFASVPGTGIVRWVELVRRPSSDEVLLVYADANNDLFAVIWTGAAWDEAGTEVTLETSLNTTVTKGFDAAYETNSGDILVAWGKDATDGITYSTKAPAGGWTAAATLTYTNDNEPEALDLASEPGGNRIACGHMTGADGGDFEAATWTGAAWANAAELDAAVTSPGTGDMNCGVGWVNTSGTAVAVFEDTDAGAEIDWAIWTSGGGWVVQSDHAITGIGSIESVQLESFTTQNKLLCVFSDTNSDVWAATNNGTAFTTTNGGAALETGLSSIATVSFSFDIRVQLSLTLANHDSGQEVDAFLEDGAVTDAELFAFKLTPSPSATTVTQLVFTISGIVGLTDGDWAGVEIRVDANANGTIEGGETTAVGGSGTVSTSGGTITFSTSFNISSATHYILRADFASLSNLDQVTLALTTANITSPATESGSASSVTHIEGLPNLDTDDLRLYYATSTSPADSPRVRTWDDSGSSWSTPQRFKSANTTIRWIVNDTPPTQNEEVIGVLSDTGSGSDLDAMRWSGSVSSVDWSSTAITSANAAKRGYDLEYESLSDDALVVYSNNTSNPQFRARSGGSWTGGASVFATPPGSGVVEWVELVAMRGSNEIALVYADANSDLFAVIWTGTAWDEAGTEVTLETSLNVTATKCFDAAYEELSGDLLVAWGRNPPDAISYATKPYGAAWTSPAALSYAGGNEPEVLDLAGDPASNNVACVHMTGADGGDFEAAVWNGSAWVNAGDLDTTADSPGAGDAPCGVGWVGTSGTAVAIYRDTDAGAEIDWVTWTSGGGWVVQTDTAVTGLGEIESVQILAFTNQSKLMAVFSDSNSDLYASTSNGSAWTVTNGGAALETGLSTIASAPFGFTVKKRVPSFSGTVRQTDEATPLTGVAMDVSLLIDGVLADTVAVNTSDGTFSLLRSETRSGQEITIYIDTTTNKGVVVTETDGTSDLPGLNLIVDRLVVRSDAGGNTTNSELETANNADADITAIYSDGGGSTLTTASGKVLYIAGSYVPGGNVTITGAGTLKVVSGGTLTLANLVTMGNASSFTVNSGGTFTASGSAELTTPTPGTDRFTSLFNGSTSITQMIFRSGETNGLNIQNGSAISSLRNVSFYNVKAVSGGAHLTIAASSLDLDVSGCYFDTLSGGAVNVAASDTGGSSDVVLRFESRSDSANGPGRGESNDADQDTNANGIIDGAETSPGAVVLWLYVIQTNTAGTFQGFPTPAFDLTSFALYSTYVAARETGGVDTDDVIYVLDADGQLKSYSYTLADANGDLVGQPFWYTEGGLHKVYFGTTAGLLYRLTDTGAALTVDTNWPINGPSANPTPFVEVTSRVVGDGTNVYFGGRENGTPVYRVYGYQISNRSQLFARTTPGALTTFPSVNGSTGTTYLYMGSDFASPNAYVYRFDVAAAANDKSYTTPSDHVRASIVHSGGNLFVGDYDGRMHGILGFSANFTGISNWPVLTPPHAALNQTEIRTASYYHPTAHRIYWGDSDGHLVDFDYSGTVRSGYPIQPDGTNAFTSKPLVNNGMIYIGNANGKLFAVDESTGNIAATFNFGSGVALTEMAWTYTVDAYLIGTSTGKVYYINAVSDPTP